MQKRTQTTRVFVDFDINYRESIGPTGEQSPVVKMLQNVQGLKLRLIKNDVAPSHCRE